MFNSAHSSDFCMPDHVHNEDFGIIQHLSPLLNESAYACGGSVLVETQTKERKNEITAPVTIRWDCGNLIDKITLPFHAEATENVKTASLQRLVNATQPASFGFKGKDVVDESYRKATKLEPSAFATNFCPYKVGIIDTIGQTLLPLPNYRSQGICAELYKLNVSHDHFLSFATH
jgi:hypothetical protein